MSQSNHAPASVITAAQPKPCEHCGSTLSGKQARFCSSRCRAAWNALRYQAEEIRERHYAVIESHKAAIRAERLGMWRELKEKGLENYR